MKTKQRVALVTGANKGIGFETVRQLRREGFHVFLGARDEKAGRAAADNLNHEARQKEDYGEVTFLKIDIANPNSIRAAAEEFGKQSDRLDALINNAGILLDDDKDILTTTPEIFREHVANQHARRAVGVASVRSVSSKERRSTDCECFQWWRPTGRWRRRLGAGLLYFENGGERRHRSARRQVIKLRGQLCVSRLGPHRHGRLECNSLCSGRSFGHSLVSDRSSSA